MCFSRINVRKVIAREVESIYRRAVDEEWSAERFMNEREKILNFYGMSGTY